MAEDPRVRETGRVTDAGGHVVIVGVDHDAVTLRTLGPAPVVLSSYQAEEFGQEYISACRQAGWQQGAASRDGGP